MKKLTLNGAWQLEIPGTDYGTVAANVPGSVYHDLLTAGLMPDPFYRDNESPGSDGQRFPLQQNLPCG